MTCNRTADVEEVGGTKTGGRGKLLDCFLYVSCSITMMQ